MWTEQLTAENETGWLEELCKHSSIWNWTEEIETGQTTLSWTSEAETETADTEIEGLRRGKQGSIHNWIAETETEILKTETERFWKIV